MSELGPHLNEDQLLWALVDETALSRAVRDHLASCDLCRGEKEAFLRKLAALGHRAAQTAPRPEGPWPPRPKRLGWGVPLAAGLWRPLTGMALVVLAVISFWWGPLLLRTPHEEATMEQTWETDVPDQLMAEINALAENPLPEMYLDLLGETDSDDVESFMQFLIPKTDNGQISINKDKKGAVTC